MERWRCILPIGALLALFPSDDASAFLPRDAVMVSFEVIVNPTEGSSRSACEASTEVHQYTKQEWWVAVAEAKPRPEKGWEAVNREIRCGSGSRSDAPSAPDATSANPYLVAEITSVARLVLQMEDEKVLNVGFSATSQRLLGFDGEQKPLYRKSRVKRSLFVSESRDIFVPLLVAGGNASETLGIHEVLVRIAARTAPEESAAVYGTVSVTSEMEEAELLLDGGAVGKISAGGKASLRNVAAGMRELRARDSLGGEVRKAVRVEPSRTVLVDLSVPAPTDAAHYRLRSLGENTHGYEEYEREADGAVVVKIPAGEFLMGNEETERSPLEHPVYVSEFLIDKTGVTWGRFKRFAEATGIPLPRHEPYWGIHDDHPAVYVSWEEARAYCEWAGGRLPTEAEREKAARGTDARKYPWGNDEPDPERAVFRRSWGKEATAAVGTHPAGASPYGILDMGGNVWEWCADWYDDEYYAASPYRDPKGPPSGRAHVVRGGSWDSRPSVLSSSCRSWGHRGYRDGDFGFRCAMNAPGRSREVAESKCGRECRIITRSARTVSGKTDRPQDLLRKR